MTELAPAMKSPASDQDAELAADELARQDAEQYRSRMLDLWLARIAVLAVAALQLLLVNDLTPFPRWLMPTLEIALLIPLSIATAWNMRKVRNVADSEDPSDTWERVLHYRRWLRMLFKVLTALISAANLLALYGLVLAIMAGHANSGRSLLIDSLNIWGTNVLIFSLWYWQIDRRDRPDMGQPIYHFVFTPEMIDRRFVPENYMPGYIDYLFLACTNAMAFSPADIFPLTQRARLLMMTQALISLVTIALVAARAVGILS